MSADFLNIAFFVLTLLTVPFWILMILLPRWGTSIRIVRSCWPFVPIAAAYVLLVLPQLPVILPLLVSSDPAAQLAYFGMAPGYLALFSHALALDLFVGCWVYRDAYRSQRSPWIVSPILFVVMMLGPLGLLVYLAIRGDPGWNEPDPRSSG